MGRCTGGDALQRHENDRNLNSDECRALSWAAGDLSGHLTLPMYTVMWNEQESKGKASTLFDDNNTDEAVDHSRLIRHKLEERITLELKKAIEHTQEARADVLQLGMLLEWNHPREWKKLKEHWSDYYADQAEIIVTSDIRIVDFGASK